MLRRIATDFGAVYAVSGQIAFIFAATGPVAIVLAVAAQGALAETDLSSWIFGAFFVNGLISIAFCLAYQQPLVFFWTTPGTVLVGPALTHLSFAELIGIHQENFYRNDRGHSAILRRSGAHERSRLR